MNMLWSKVAERSRRQRHYTFYEPVAMMKWSWIYREQFWLNGVYSRQIGEDLVLCW